MNNEILIDANGKDAVYIALKNNEFLELFEREINKDLTNFLVSSFRNFVERNFGTINNVNTIYFVNGPGSFTNVRLVNVMLKTLATLNSHLQLKYLDRLSFFADYNQDEIVYSRSSTISKFIFIHAKDKSVKETQLVSNEEFENLQKNHANFILKDIDLIPFKKNFYDVNKLNLSHFKMVTNLDQLEAGYFKDPNIDKNSLFNKN